MVKRLIWVPPELVPIVSHSLVAVIGQGTTRMLLVRRLYDYLDFTRTRGLAVLPVTAKISRGRAGVKLPPAMRADAFKITTDEAWHAQMAYGMKTQGESRTGVAPGVARVPAFTERLDSVRDRLPDEAL